MTYRVRVWPFHLRDTGQSHRWEILVEIEWQGIEFLTSRVGPEGPELVPPWLASVFPYLTIPFVQCVVQEISQDTRNKSFRCKWHVNHIVELKNSKTQVTFLSKIFYTTRKQEKEVEMIMIFRAMPICHTHRPPV